MPPLSEVLAYCTEAVPVLAPARTSEPPAKMVFVPSVVCPDMPPNAPELLYWTCVLEPPGVPEPPPVDDTTGFAGSVESTVTFVPATTDCTTPSAPGAPVAPVPPGAPVEPLFASTCHLVVSVGNVPAVALANST